MRPPFLPLHGTHTRQVLGVTLASCLVFSSVSTASAVALSQDSSVFPVSTVQPLAVKTDQNAIPELSSSKVEVSSPTQRISLKNSHTAKTVQQSENSTSQNNTGAATRISPTTNNLTLNNSATVKADSTTPDNTGSNTPSKKKTSPLFWLPEGVSVTPAEGVGTPTLSILLSREQTLRVHEEQIGERLKDFGATLHPHIGEPIAGVGHVLAGSSSFASTQDTGKIVLSVGINFVPYQWYATAFLINDPAPETEPTSETESTSETELESETDSDTSQQ